MPSKSSGQPISRLPARDRKSGSLNVIVETPKGSHAKFDYDEELGLFRLGGMLPEGSTFPYSFGFIPATKAPDGDPLDVLILMEEPAFTGCLVLCRPIGVIEAEQTEEDGKTTRNDRLIAVAAHSREHADVESLKHLPKALAKEIEHFFVSYNEVRGKRFRPLGSYGPHRAEKLIEAAKRRRRRAGKT
jgi:inorganic pyrophosphatase